MPDLDEALRRWPVEGIPDRPDAWLFTVARRRGLDVLRRGLATAQIAAAFLVRRRRWPTPDAPQEEEHRRWWVLVDVMHSDGRCALADGASRGSHCQVRADSRRSNSASSISPAA